MPIKTLIIAHGDLDGLTSAAIIAAALKNTGRTDSVTLRFTQPFTLQDELRRIPPGHQRIVIVDIALDEEHIDHILQALRSLPPDAEKLWVDHHSSTLRHTPEIAGQGFTTILSLHGCAATLAGRIFLPMTGDPDFYSKLVAIGEAGDKVREIPDTDPLRHYVEVLGNALAAEPTDNAFKEHLVRMWVDERRLVDDEAAARAEKALERLRELLREADRNIAYDSDKVRVINLRGTRVHGYAGKIASYHVRETGKTVLVLFNVGTNATIVTARAPQASRIDLAATIKQLAPRHGGGGGGHPKAASARIPALNADDFVKDLVKAVEEAS